MKKIILMAVCSAGIAGTVNAQSARIGVKVGMAYSKIGGQFLNDTEIGDGESLASLIEYKPGIAAGIGINSMVSDYFWLKHEFMFMNKGYKATYENSDGSMETVTDRYYYFDAYPIMFAAHFHGAQLFFGPAASVMINRSFKYKDENGADKIETGTDGKAMGNLSTGSLTSDEGAQFIQFDAGIVAGFEYEFNFGLNIGFRYIYGMVPLYEKSYNPKDIQDPSVISPEKEKTQIYNRSMLFTVGYTLGREKK